MRFFNTTGPVRLDKYYVIPPLERLGLDADCARGCRVGLEKTQFPQRILPVDA